MQHERLAFVSNLLRIEFLSAREEWCKTQCKNALDTAIAYHGALNQVELQLYNEKLTSFLTPNSHEKEIPLNEK